MLEKPNNESPDSNAGNGKPSELPKPETSPTDPTAETKGRMPEENHKLPVDVTPDPPVHTGTEQFEYRQLVQMLEMKSARVSIEFGVKDILCVITQLQLAFRHPANRSRTAFTAWMVKEFLIGFLDEIQPGVGRHLHKGDGSFFDKAKAKAQGKKNGDGESAGRIIMP